MTYSCKDKLILRQYLTSYNGHDMLTLFAGGLESRKFDKVGRQEYRRYFACNSWTLVQLLRVCRVVDFWILLVDTRVLKMMSDLDIKLRQIMTGSAKKMRTAKEKTDKGFEISVFLEKHRRMWRNIHLNVSRDSENSTFCVKDSWCYWRTYISIPFMHICWIWSDFWWVCRMQEYQYIFYESCCCDLLLSIIWAGKKNDAS